MTKEEKELLIKDLCARLPYGLIVKETFQEAQKDVSVWDCGPYYIKGHPEKVKPYLRPMSSITEEEERDWWTYKQVGTTWEAQDSLSVDWLNAHHFDYRGLIPIGLALEAPDDMYK